MNLRETRVAFTLNISRLIVWVSENLPGYQLCYNEVLRTQAQANANANSGAGISNSLHLVGLAADLNLYKFGVFQTDSAAHKPIAERWKIMHPLARWGGDFKDARGRPKPDGNHYSFEWEGRK